MVTTPITFDDDEWLPVWMFDEDDRLIVDPEDPDEDELRAS
jgi:hypothetical protein